MEPLHLIWPSCAALRCGGGANAAVGTAASLLRSHSLAARAAAPACLPSKRSYAKLKAADGKEVIGWENIELISDRPLEVMLKEFKQLKAEFPGRVLIASIMEEYTQSAVSEAAACVLLSERRRDCCFGGWLLGRLGKRAAHTHQAGPPSAPARPQWEELIERCQEAGVDAFEVNFSCPHGMPERKMGMAMGQVRARGGGAEGHDWRECMCVCQPASRSGARRREDPHSARLPTLHSPLRTARSCTRCAAGSTPRRPCPCGPR